MNKLQESLNNSLNEIYKLIDYKDQKEACIKYYNLILELEKIQFDDINRLYYECAMLLFNNKYYEECVKFLSKAYSSGYKKIEIKEYIFTNFINNNKIEFFESFKKNIEKYNSIYKYFKIEIDAYEELDLEFIPVNENRYFIFDLKLDNFSELIDFSEESLLNTNPYECKRDEFSDILLIDDFNIEKAKRYIISSSNKKIYYYSLNPKKTLSFFKLPNIIEKYLKNVLIFNSENMIQNYFRSNLHSYLPRLVFDLSNKKTREIRISVNNILENEHEFRLTKEGRCNKNILLSICIPTWNRGNLALKNIKRLLQLPYDSEVEFVVSDNGSQKYIKEYKQIESLSDSRVKYYRFPKNMGVIANFENVIRIAEGKFTLLLSDEDAINIRAIAHYMNLLKSNFNVGVVRAASVDNYTYSDSCRFLAGYDALKNIFLCNNYVSGAIYNRRIFNDCNLKQFSVDNSNNIAFKFYPHLFWDSIIALYGDVVFDKSILIVEGESVLEEQINIGVVEGDPDIKESISIELDNMPIYQTYESRILQHYGFIELINFLKINSKEVIIYLYISLCFKTNMLVSLCKDIYLKNGYDLNIIYDQILECCIDGISHIDMELSYDEKEVITSFAKKYNDEYRVI